MKTFLIGLALHLLVWGPATAPLLRDPGLHIWSLLGVAIYFALFFLTPLFYKKIKWLTVLFSSKAAAVAFIFFPAEHFEFTPLVLLVYWLMMSEAAEMLPFNHLIVPYSIALAAVASFIIAGDVSPGSAIFSTLFMVLSLAGFVYYKLKAGQRQELAVRYEQLHSEYRRIKRRVAEDEENARQEERHMIGKEIHDSVGHKLTSLIMQLEAYRIQSGTKGDPHVLQLKKLADESLEETRRAVKTFKQEEIGGLQGVMRLIRKLELESFIRIHFTVNHGAFAAPLTGEQSFAIYRAVQEGLTNIMKHSQSREAQITFEAPGGSIFRFEITNPVKQATAFKEDYGLLSMRERLESLGGGLEAHINDKEFILRGWVKLKKRGDHDDSRVAR